MEKLLLSTFLIYRSNFDVLHWKACGPDFDSYHKLMEDYSKNLSEDIDTIAEILILLGQDPVNYVEAIEEVKENNTISVKVLKSSDNYDSEQMIELTSEMLTDIIVLIKRTIDDLGDSIVSAGVKSELEGLLYKYNKDEIYLNRRRKQKSS